MAKTYAEAVATPTRENNVKNIRIQQRFVLYKITPNNISTNKVIQDIANSLKVEATTAIFGVHRDTRYKCRFTVIFKDSKFITQIRQNGLRVGDTTIAPKNSNATRGYLPNLPVYALEDKVRQLLSKHGKVTYLKARTRKDGIRIGGWIFLIELEMNMPNTILYENEQFDVVYEGKPKITPPSPTQIEINTITNQASTPPKQSTTEKHEETASEPNDGAATDDGRETQDESSTSSELESDNPTPTE